MISNPVKGTTAQGQTWAPRNPKIKDICTTRCRNQGSLDRLQGNVVIPDYTTGIIARRTLGKSPVSPITPDELKERPLTI